MGNGFFLASLLMPAVLSLAGGSHATPALTFEQRVEAQRAIERVYYSHQIGATLPFDEAVPLDLLEKKVRTYLRQSAALATIWHAPITADMLREEAARVAARTRMPVRLRELYTALSDDPLLVQECLIRPALVSRLARARFESDEAVRAAGSRGASTRKLEWDDWWGSVENDLDESSVQVVADSSDLLTQPAGMADAAGATCMPDDVWDNGSLGSPPFVPGPRSRHTAVWTGNLMIVWGGEFNSTYRQTGGRYDPTTDVWTPTSIAGAPAGRGGHTAVWTGSRMIVWGGFSNVGQFADGGLYDPASDTWSHVSDTNTPTARSSHTAVWSGSEMIVWGGYSVAGNIYLSTGGRYNPSTDTWSAVQTAGAPSGRQHHTAVWTGAVMVVWGGDNGTFLDTGGRYDPVANSWSTTTIGNAPSPRQLHTAVWTGSEMVLWGGWGPTIVNTGARYDPVGNKWKSTSATGAPSARYSHTAVWTGSRMLVSGGTDATDGTNSVSTGASYDPVANTWSPSADAPLGRFNHTAVWTGSTMVVFGGSGSDAAGSWDRYDPAANVWLYSPTQQFPSPRQGHTATWTGNVMVVWGGHDGSGLLRTGGMYDPVLDSWTATSTAGAPEARFDHTSVWTGTFMVVWGGGSFGTYFNTGGRFNPITNGWFSMTPGSSPRARHTAVWTGSRMIIWGGLHGVSFNNRGGESTGAAYDPSLDTWSNLAPSPLSARYWHTAVWTGSRMIVWGGCNTGSNFDDCELGFFSDGALYDPASNSWTPTTLTGAPSARTTHTGLWTGNRMIVWGGIGSFHNDLNTGGQYDPVSNSWSATSTLHAPFLPGHRAVWTGELMLIWGGGTVGSSRYNPVGDVWRPITTVGAPPNVASHTAVWTGDSMIIWGGTIQSSPTNGGGRYLVDTGPDGDHDGYTVCGGDCDDMRLSVAPGAPQLCDGLNNDCRDPSWPAVDPDENDTDGDGSRVCAGDCDDSNAAIYAGAPQVCGDGLNNDCAHPSWPSLTGTNELDDDGDGLSECSGDCDDLHATVRPGAPQICDGLDNDCNHANWPAVPANEADADTDGYRICGGDCDDMRASVHPGAVQLCDGLNNNCSDPAWPTMPANEADADADGYRICGGDCDDTRATVRPGGPQLCGDQLNNNCSLTSWPSLSGTNEFDDDGDSFTECQGDCNDAWSFEYPGAPEVCDGINDNCSDPQWPLLSSPETDNDGDRHGVCASLPSTDCNDNDARIWSAPGEVLSLRLADPEGLLWQTPSSPGGTIIWYDTLRAVSSADFFTNTTCVETNNGPNTLAEDLEYPLEGEIFFYLVRAENFCPSGQNQGPLGFASDGSLRTGRSCP